jgi:hypothetical protein
MVVERERNRPEFVVTHAGTGCVLDFSEGRNPS